MIKVRKHIFETNSSSSHSIVLSPVVLLPDDTRKNGGSEIIPFCEKKKMLVLNNDPGYDFGTYYRFYDKLNYVISLMLSTKREELRCGDDSDWDEYSFPTWKGNAVLEEYFSPFCDKIVKYVQKRYGIDCKKIGFMKDDEKEFNKCKCRFNFDHEVLSCASEENLGFEIDPYEIITTDGMAILYEFC